MKQFAKYAAVGLAGYLVGFYEFKYRFLKAIAEKCIEEQDQNDSKKENEEES